MKLHRALMLALLLVQEDMISSHSASDQGLFLST